MSKLIAEQQGLVVQYFPYLQSLVKAMAPKWRKVFNQEDLESIGNELICIVFLKLPEKISTEEGIRGYIRVAFIRSIVSEYRRLMKGGQPLPGKLSKDLEEFMVPDPELDPELEQQLSLLVEGLPAKLREAVLHKYPIRESMAPSANQATLCKRRKEGLALLKDRLATKGFTDLNRKVA